MIPFGLLPWYIGMSGSTSLIIVTICNLWMVAVSIKLFLKMDVKSARMVMFSSYFYLMIVLLALFADRIMPGLQQ
jgi:protoheme IX farnesyltransferase